MENTKRYLPERKNRGNRILELAKDEGKMLEDDKYGIFKEEQNDEDFNPDDIKNEDSSLEEEEEEDDDEENEEEEDDESNYSNNKQQKSEFKIKSKKQEEILDIEQLDIDKIDMLEDLKDRGIHVKDEEELERRMREYNEEIESDEE